MAGSGEATAEAAADQMALPRLDLALRERFASLGAASGTEKVLSHGFQRFYAPWLSLLPADFSGAILEIGYGEGRSLSLWTALLPMAEVWCLDRDYRIEAERVHVLNADQNDLASIQRAIAAIDRPVALIIDNGSHLPRHQLSSFSLLFSSLLQPGGFYSVEAIETSYWLAGEIDRTPARFGVGSPWSAVEAFKLAADYLNRSMLDSADRDRLEYALSLCGLAPEAVAEIGMLSFAQNCILITKAFEADQAYAERPYRFAALTQR